jgi:hypothetical protein
MSDLIDRDYIVNVGPLGTFEKSGTYQTVPKDIDDMFLKFEKDNVRNISLYFHGGLVGEIPGLATARKIGPEISAAGSAPVCFVWETGLLEIVKTNISKISETPLYTKLLKLLLKKVSGRLGINSLGGRGGSGQELSYAEINLELSKPVPFVDYELSNTERQSRSATVITALPPNSPIKEAEMAQEMQIEIERDPDFKRAIANTKLTVNATGNQTGARGPIELTGFISHAVKVAFRIIKRFLAKRDHDLYPTTVEEILREFYIAEAGAWVWKGMKDKAEIMWTDNSARVGDNQYAGRYFLDSLAKYKAKFPDTLINVVGHSAGSTATCNLLKYTDKLSNRFTYNHIIFMAPACRIDLFKSEMTDHKERYKDLRIFTMTNNNECQDRMIPFFYTHSLLYLISGILEDEGVSFDAYILGLERDIDFVNPYDIPELSDVHSYLYEPGKNRLVLSQTPGGPPDGLQTQSLSHGGFDDDPLTIASVQYIIQHT